MPDAHSLRRGSRCSLSQRLGACKLLRPVRFAQLSMDACIACLRRVGLHRRFHAQGTMSHLACLLLISISIAKDLKTMPTLTGYLSSTILRRLFICTSKSPVEGYIPFPLFL
jgi:hypothetical protein